MGGNLFFPSFLGQEFFKWLTLQAEGTVAAALKIIKMSAVSDDLQSKTFIKDLEECLAYVQKRQKKSKLVLQQVNFVGLSIYLISAWDVRMAFFSKVWNKWNREDNIQWNR